VKVEVEVEVERFCRSIVYAGKTMEKVFAVIVGARGAEDSVIRGDTERLKILVRLLDTMKQKYVLHKSDVQSIDTL
jgi:hypothetical protein